MARSLKFRKKRDCTIRVAKTKALISFAYAKVRFSHDAAQSVNEGVQCRMVLVVNCFDFLKLLFLCFVVAIFDLVYHVEAINDLC